MSVRVTHKITSVAKFRYPGDDVEKTSENENSFVPPYVEGQIIFVEGKNIYLDFHNYRKCYSRNTDEHQDFTDAVKNRGESSTNPETGIVTINGSVYVPTENDMVSYGQKEYIYRKDKDSGVLKWCEVGDEDMGNWNE